MALFLKLSESLVLSGQVKVGVQLEQYDNPENQFVPVGFELSTEVCDLNDASRQAQTREGVHDFWPKVSPAGLPPVKPQAEYHDLCQARSRLRDGAGKRTHFRHLSQVDHRDH